jgi:GTPase SAR1 family protein
LTLNILFIGPAGCGKTTLTSAFGKWLERDVKAAVKYVNLDPGCKVLPYKPDFDIRELFTIDELMKDEKLGPNGAMIRASELMKDNSNVIVDMIGALDADVKLVDTPGQMEIFVFRPAGPALIETLRKTGATIVVYIIDPALASTASGLATAFSLAIATQLRLDAPTVMVLNKSDELNVQDIDELLTDPEYLRKRAIAEKSGAMIDLALHCVDAVKELSKFYRVVKISAKTGSGMEDLYSLCHEAFCCCGEL